MEDKSWAIGFVGLGGLLGLESFVSQNPWQLLFFCYFGFFFWFGYKRECLKYLGLLGVAGLIVAVFGLLGGMEALVPAFRIGPWNAWIFILVLLMQNFVISLVKKQHHKGLPEQHGIKVTLNKGIVKYYLVSIWALTAAYSIFVPLKLGTVWFYTGLTVFALSLVANLLATTSLSIISGKNTLITGIRRFFKYPFHEVFVLTYLAIGIASINWVFMIFALIWVVLVYTYAVNDESC